MDGQPGHHVLGGGAVNYGNPAATTLLYPDTFGTSGGDFGPNFEFSP